ncbi:uncharacterized protein A4U43_C03F22470 [Asparagus officinalis]|uniref:Uncharacterized protein n=1 Tax=Asparagus officinalis TaxID=4686 RepID=A0A5P1FHA5_ASPOF|nr:uncharacterized protein LOC109834224 [Asparagus officinalis]ONK75970.1 uncharacterized protein A4U43_C03F22470 [Asparagus officinalis]
MAHSSLVKLSLCLLVLLSLFVQSTVGGRPVPASNDKKETECEGRDGINLLGGAVRIGGGGVRIGGLPSIGTGNGGGGTGALTRAGFGSGSIGDLDHSAPAAARPRYLPGNDDTFVPNPGYEVPNPFRGSSPNP